MNQKTTTILKSFLIVVAFMASLSAIAVWEQAGSSPLGGNPPPPLNVGSASMMRVGPTVFGNGLRSVGLFIANSTAQFDGNVNIDGSIQIGSKTSGGSEASSSSAKMEINSTTQGFLPPRMTYAQRNAILNPVAGLLIYQTNNLPGIYYYNGVSWAQLAPASDPRPLP